MKGDDEVRSFSEHHRLPIAVQHTLLPPLVAFIGRVVALLLSMCVVVLRCVADVWLVVDAMAE